MWLMFYYVFLSLISFSVFPKKMDECIRKTRKSWQGDWSRKSMGKFFNLSGKFDRKTMLVYYLMYEDEERKFENHGNFWYNREKPLHFPSSPFPHLFRGNFLVKKSQTTGRSPSGSVIIIFTSFQPYRKYLDFSTFLNPHSKKNN